MRDHNLLTNCSPGWSHSIWHLFAISLCSVSLPALAAYYLMMWIQICKGMCRICVGISRILWNYAQYSHSWPELKALTSQEQTHRACECFRLSISCFHMNRWNLEEKVWTLWSKLFFYSYCSLVHFTVGDFVLEMQRSVWIWRSRHIQTSLLDVETAMHMLIFIQTVL